LILLDKSHVLCNNRRKRKAEAVENTDEIIDQLYAVPAAHRAVPAARLAVRAEALAGAGVQAAASAEAEGVPAGAAAGAN